MAKLCETIAVLKGVKSRVYAAITKQDKLCQKPGLFGGLSKTYEPLNEEDPDRPDGESTLVQQRTDEMISDMMQHLSKLFDKTATLEYGNCTAKADIVVKDGGETHTLVKGVPVTYMLFLEKQLNDLYTAVARMPVLSPEHQWAWDGGKNCWVTPVVKKVRTKKTPKVVFTATAKTTAKDGSVTEQQQGQVVQEDLPVGYWNTTHFSSALPEEKRQRFCARILELQDAVKEAREWANSAQVSDQAVGQTLLGWVFSR